MSESEWTCDTTIRLVEEWRSRPQLWDSQHELYRVQTAKYEAWAEMARIFECDIADLRKKLNSVSASYRREKAKIRSGGRSTWFLYPYFTFLPKHLEPNTPQSTNDIQPSHTDRSDQSSDNDDDMDRGEHEVVIKQEPTIEAYCIEQPAAVEHHKLNSGQVKRQPLKRLRMTRPLLKRTIVKDNQDKNSLDSRLLETLRLLRKSDLSRKKDECDSFGEYIAVSLRKHDERTQSMIKQAINNILFEQEMKKYNAGHYTVVLQGVDENPLVLGDSDDK